MHNMNIILNGNSQKIPAKFTLNQLVETLDLAGRRYAIEVNEQLIPRSQHPSHHLQENDNIEIVQAIGGG